MKCSYHVHSRFSDGKDSIFEILQYAKKLDLTEIGFSDHFGIIPSRIHPGSSAYELLNEHRVKDMDAYVSEIQSLSGEDRPKVRMGIEADFFPETFSTLKTTLSRYPFDYVIGSVHFVDDIPVDAFPESFPTDYSTRIMKKYYQTICAMAESKTFDIVGHFDLVKKFGLKPQIDLSKEIHQALLAIKNAGMAVEINTSGWFYPCKEQYPSLDILRKCKELDIPVLVSSDAHKKENLDRGFDQAYQLLRQIGYKNLVSYQRRSFTLFPIPD